MWNQDAETYLAKDPSHIIMVSEHRLDEPMFRPISKKLAAWRRSTYVSYAERTGTARWATSGGLAILPRRHLHTEMLDSELRGFCCNGNTASAAACRWWPCVLRLKSVSVLFIIVYLKTGEELSEFNQSVLQQVFLATAHFGGPVVIAGDWQMEPQTLLKSPMISKLGLEVLAPKGVVSTCEAGKGRLLDFMLVSSHIYSVMQLEADFAVPWVPHAALRAKFPFRPRSFMIPTIRVPRPLPELPVGDDGLHVFQDSVWNRSCHLARAYVQKWSNNTGVIGATEAIMQVVSANQAQMSKDHCFQATCTEFYATEVAGIPAGSARPYLGRGGLPHVAVKPAIHRNFANNCFQAPMLQVWAQLHTLLGWLVRPRASAGRTVGAEQLPIAKPGQEFQFPPSPGRGTTQQRAQYMEVVGRLYQPICQLRKIIPMVSQAWRGDVAPNAPVSAWVAWAEGLTPTAIIQEFSGYSQERVRTWVSRAAAQKSKAISVRSNQWKRDFKKWLSEDLSQGASRAHAMVKEASAVPYVPPTAVGGVFASWAKIWEDQRFAVGVPESFMDSGQRWSDQCEQLVKAACLGSNASFLSDAKHVANTIDVLEDATVGKFRSAAKSYPDKKGRGIDAWSTNFLAILPDEVLSGFVSTLNAAQCNLCWPIQVLLNLVSLIPKPLGGERPISKTPMLYRLWSVTRAEGVKSWAAANVGEYDFAAAGRSALYSSSARCLTNEIAVLSGQHTASLLWDMEKFFDSIPPQLVVEQGLRLGYPVVDLVLAVAMHIAPRIMVLSRTASPLIFPLLSILAGCMHSINFARLVMEKPVVAVVRRVPDVRTSTFVDDVAQIAIGTLRQVADKIVHAGVLLATKLVGLRFRLSDKSVVVASNDKLANAIARTISKHAGVALRAERAGRDLGVLNNPSGRRRTSVQAKRVAKATIRASKIAKLARLVRRANVLAYTGALPAATWGVAALGAAPTVVKRLRASIAAASGIVAHGRCSATAIAITMGPSRDPVVAIPTLQVSLWMDLWKGEASLRASAVRQWSTAWCRITGRQFGHEDRSLSIAEATFQPCLFEKRARWPMVLGPMTATMATLYDQGWNLANPARWEDPSGQVWTPDLSMQKEPFLQLVEDFATNLVWRAAATGWCGKGLESGVDWTATLSLYQHISMLNKSTADEEREALVDEPSMEWQADLWLPTASSWLELFLTGGYWPQQRLASIHQHVSDQCTRCNAAVESAFHLIWECPCNGDIRDARVVDSQPLIFEARRSAHEFPCLWLRGLLPKELVAISTPFAIREDLQFVKSAPVGLWPSGHYHTDASGGIYSSLPLIRRCGIGIAFVCQDDMQFNGAITEDLFLWGCFSALPGSIHTVVRAELFAIVLVVKYAVREACIVVHSDSKVNVDAFLQGRQHCLSAAHADLWLQLWQLVCEKGLEFQLRWTKGHVSTPEMMQQYDVSARHLFGNCCADRLAARGAEMAQVYLQDAMNLKWHYALVRRVQARAVAILSTVMQRESTLTKQPKSAKVRKLSSNAHVLTTQHSITAMTRTLHCDKCLKHSDASEKGRMSFLCSPCVVDGPMVQAITLGNTRPTAIDNNGRVQVGTVKLHGAHSLACFKGLYFCTRCGYFASAKAQGLVADCTARGPAAVKRVKRLREGKLPSGMSRWPNDAYKPSNLVEVYGISDNDQIVM